MQEIPHFDYLIIGSGLAGLQLALQMGKDPFFDRFTIGLIDPSEKTTNDKTWSFWEQGEGCFDSVVYKSWNRALFKSSGIALSMPLDDYRYKTIRSLDFYTWARNQLASKQNFHFILDTVEKIKEKQSLEVIGTVQSYLASHIFDSRIPEAFYQQQDKHTVIHQHFKGWVIESEVPCFNTEEFTMMDYRFQYKDSTSFIYVLPFSETKALVEFTFFTPYTVASDIYETAIKTYISQELNIDDYHIKETEVGNIPMTDFPFWKYHSKHITKIGTAGGWVKGSTGYSFKHTEKNVAKLISNIKTGVHPSKNLINKKFKFYDKIFLKVLHDKNEKGVWIFERFYSKNSVSTMFRFLDEETSFREDIQIMNSLFSMAFITAFFKVLFKR